MFRRTPIENYCLSKQIIFVKERLFSIIISVFVLESSRDLFLLLWHIRVYLSVTIIWLPKFTFV